jgi:predicted AlkP superfamily pyrophosphatase or phosphodiesterase
MKKILIALLLWLFCHAAYSAESFLNATLASKPKLVVGIVVDQMRADFIYKYWSKYGNGGFKRLVNEGFFFKNSQYNYVPTYTGPGHAAIYTGATPALNGIIANTWFDKITHKRMYCTDDITVHALGGTEKAGQMSPKNMLTTTIGDQLKLSNNGQSKVIGIALKDRGAILPAGHIANAAYWFDSATGEWMSSSYYMEQLPAWVTAFNNNGMAKAYLNKQWQPLLPLTDYRESLSDDNKFEGAFKGENKPVFPHDLPKLAAENDNFGLLRTTPFGNTLTKDFAVQAIQAEKLGKHTVTDMLTVSFSATDYVGHQFAPQSVEVEDTYLRLDQDLSELLQFLDTWLGKEQVLVFLTADHGVVESPAYLESLRIPAGSIKVKELAVELEKFLQEKYGENLLLNYSNQQVFLDVKKIQGLKLSVAEVENALADFLMTIKGVNEAVPKTVLASHYFNEGINHYIQLGYHPQRSGDVMVSYAPGWIEAEKATGTTHGSSYSYDTHVPLLWYGWKIANGQSLQTVEITDIATTIALLLDIQAPNGNFGKALPLLVK